MTPLYEDETATADFVPIGAFLSRLFFQCGIPEAHDCVANDEFAKARETIEGLPGGVGYEERTARLQQQAAEAWERGRPRCESPIEKVLLPWLICQRYPFFSFNPAVLFPGETDQYIPDTLAVIPQLPIGRYRVDFALVGSLSGLTRFVVIECDGKEFHDGVVNVKRDVDRDVAILANRRVLDVFRLDGADILRDPRGSGLRAAGAVYEAWRRK